jgi:hypothetical protein
VEDNKPLRLKMPIGSIVIDGAMVFALIWSWATMTEALKSFDVRLHTVELATSRHGDYESRLSVIEVTELSQDKNYEELKQDIVKRLDRIEAKLDKIK